MTRNSILNCLCSNLLTDLRVREWNVKVNSIHSIQPFKKLTVFVSSTSHVSAQSIMMYYFMCWQDHVNAARQKEICEKGLQAVMSSGENRDSILQQLNRSKSQPTLRWVTLKRPDWHGSCDRPQHLQPVLSMILCHSNPDIHNCDQLFTIVKYVDLTQTFKLMRVL